MATDSRLGFALNALRPSDWERFENFCGKFFASEFEGYRSIGGTNDKGRDGILLAHPERPGVILQYSITPEWRSKIASTVKRLREEHVNFSILIYATNQSISTKADGLQDELRDSGIALDVRDKRYFTDRSEKSEATRAASEALSSLIVNPLLPPTPLVHSSDLSQPQQRAGLLYLELQLRDAHSERNLTKLAAEALVLASLAQLEPGQRKSRQQIVDDVRTQFPATDAVRVKALVSGALTSLQHHRRVTYTKRDDDFALHYAETLLLADRLQKMATARQNARSALAQRVAVSTQALQLDGHPEDSEEFLNGIEAVFETLLLTQGEDFVRIIDNPDSEESVQDVYDISRTTLTERAHLLRNVDVSPNDLWEIAADTVEDVIIRPGEDLQDYLRTLADSYTLLAFLRRTPDVQDAVSRLLSFGKLIIDTTVVLPCFGETLLPPADRRFSNILASARDVGMDLYVTPGVLNEIVSHIFRSVRCHTTPRNRWEGDYPFFYAQWLSFGGGRDQDFFAYVEKFQGRNRPEDDIRDFLDVELGIKSLDLSSVWDSIDKDYRWAFTEVWRERKRRWSDPFSEADLDLRLRHDAEMYLGTLKLRESEPIGTSGHQWWWVTIDSTAFQVRGLASASGLSIPSAPCMHPNFLTNTLALGPSRRMLRDDLRSLLPVALGIQQAGWGVSAISEQAAKIRLQYAGQPEYFIRRKLRDIMDHWRSTSTPKSEIGFWPDRALTRAG